MSGRANRSHVIFAEKAKFSRARHIVCHMVNAAIEHGFRHSPSSRNCESISKEYHMRTAVLYILAWLMGVPLVVLVILYLLGVGR